MSFTNLHKYEGMKNKNKIKIKKTPENDVRSVTGICKHHTSNILHQMESSSL